MRLSWRVVLIVMLLAAVGAAFGSSGVGVKPPELLRFTAPTYSGSVDEKVTAIVTVSTDGKVQDVTVPDGADTRLGNAVVTAVRKWEFVPAMRGGRVVSIKVSILFSFDSRSNEVTVDLGHYLD